MTEVKLDRSHLDAKYFIDPHVYNCPFCNRRHIKYRIFDHFDFHWSDDKACYVYLVQCSDCERVSMHLCYEDIRGVSEPRGYRINAFASDIDIDSKIFYSRPTSFFAVDPRVPVVIRELITEAEGCLKMSFLTGASACMRKAIYELTVKEEAEGRDYESKVKSLKTKYKHIDPDLFDILAQIQGMTSDKIHEQSWDKWESPHLKLIIETLKSVLYEIYVLPSEKKGRSSRIKELMVKIKGDKETVPSKTVTQSTDVTGKE